MTNCGGDSPHNIEEDTMDWKNVDLNDGYEQDQCILDGYTFNQLLLEINHNLREITEETVMAQFEESLRSKIECARDVMRWNIKNITKKAKQERANV